MTLLQRLKKSQALILKAQSQKKPAFLKQALDQLKIIQNQDPDRPETLLLLAYISFCYQHYDQALGILMRVQEPGPYASQIQHLKHSLLAQLESPQISFVDTTPQVHEAHVFEDVAQMQFPDF